MRSYKNFASGFARPRSVTCVHEPWHLEWNTPGSPDGTQGYLAACYRNKVDTKPSHFSKPNPEADRKSNRKSNRLRNQKKYTYLVPPWIIAWTDWCGARFALATVPRKFNFPYATSDQRSLLCANFVQHKSALPYMGCCTLSSFSFNKGPRILGPTM